MNVLTERLASDLRRANRLIRLLREYGAQTKEIDLSTSAVPRLRVDRLDTVALPLRGIVRTAASGGGWLCSAVLEDCIVSWQEAA